MIADGVAPNLAIKRAIEQLKGKIFLYPSDPGAKPFVSEAFAKAGMVLTDVHAEMVDDAEQIPLMLTKRADAQVSGVPVRLQLQADGFQVLVSAADLVKSATPSANSPELLTVFRDGAATTEEWYTSNEDTALRFVSVVFRITDFIHSQPTTAAKIEGPFVNYLSGTSLKTSSTLLAYNSLDPFYTFSMQKEWYDDVNSPFYYAYEIGAYIKYWEEQKLFTPGAVTVDDIALNAVVYKKMEGYRSQASALITKTERKIAGRQGAPAQLLAAAQTYYTHFNFLDAWRFAQAAASKA